MITYNKFVRDVSCDNAASYNFLTEVVGMEHDDVLSLFGKQKIDIVSAEAKKLTNEEQYIFWTWYC